MVLPVVLLALALGAGEPGGQVPGAGSLPGGLAGAGEPVPQPVERLARDVAALVGAPLSPLFMLGILGGHEWWRAGAAARPALPWHARPWFWGGALLVTLLLWLSDKVPALRHALKPLRLYESKVSGAFVALVLVERFARDATRAVEPVVAGAGQLLLSTAWAADGGRPAAARRSRLPPPSPGSSGWRWWRRSGCWATPSRWSCSSTPSRRSTGSPGPCGWRRWASRSQPPA